MIMKTEDRLERRDDDLIIKGYSFFVEDSDIGEFKVICINRGKYTIENWFGVDVDNVVIFWSDDINLFLKFIKDHDISFIESIELSKIKLVPLLVEKNNDKKTIELV